MHVNKFYVFSIFILISSFAFGQHQKSAFKGDNQVQDIKCRWITNPNNAAKLDSLSLMPGSLVIFNPEGKKIYEAGTPSGKSFYHYNYNTGRIHFKGPLPDSIKVCYEVLAFSLNHPKRKRDYTAYDSSAFFPDRKNRNRESRISSLNDEGILSNSQLKKSGSLSRGFSMGNRQDVVMDSRLNLNLAGKLNEDLHINAVINDQNIPIQPMGYSQQLQNFDQVFIEIYNDFAGLQAGDLTIQNTGETGLKKEDQWKNSGDTSSHFLKYYKSIQGGGLTTRYKTGTIGSANTSIKAGISKGRFASVNLDIQEGVQGPYQLIRGHTTSNSEGGIENAFYIIASSEKVFLNGKRLKRGRDHDYVIDYNLGEISFTNNVLITKHSRIRVEFEYADRNYSRSIIKARHQQEIGDFTITTNYYNEKDNPQQAYRFDLTSQNKTLLNKIGDDLDKAIVSTARPVSIPENNYNPIQNSPGIGRQEVVPVSRVLYQKKDTVEGGKTYQIFQYIPQPRDSTSFSVQFNRVGTNKGNYKVSKSTVNGRVYKWVAPDDGQPQGNYSPLKNLPAPRQKRMVTTHTGWKINNRDQINTEIAFSENDLNVLSQKDAGDNQGKAFMLNYLRGNRPVKFLSGYNWNTKLAYEYSSQYFSTIERYRDVEFERFWNTNYSGNQNQENQNSKPLNVSNPDHLVKVQTNIKKDRNNFLSYRASGRYQPDYLQGFQQHLELAQEINTFQWKNKIFLMENQLPRWKAHWQRYTSTVKYAGKKIMPGYQFDLNKNQIKSSGADSVLHAEDYYQAHKIFIQNRDSATNNFYWDYSLRKDQYPYKGTMDKQEIAHTTHAKWHSQFSTDHNLTLNFTYRAIENNQSPNLPESSGITPLNKGQRNTLLGSIDYHNTFLARSIRTQMDYKIANSRELKRAFVYVKVPTGQGTYTWRDENENGIEEITEFYKAKNPDEMNYAKMYAASDEYILAYENDFHYQLHLEAPGHWQKASGLKKFIKRFTSQTTWKIRKKVDENNIATRTIPFLYPDDKNLLSIRESLFSTLYFNRHQTKFGFQSGINQFKQKQLLSYGFEKRTSKKYHFNTRYSITPKLQISVNNHLNFRESQLSGSDNQTNEKIPDLDNRNFRIKTLSSHPELTWRIKRNIRLSGNYEWSGKKNSPTTKSYSTENQNSRATAEIHKIGSRLNMQTQSSNTINASLKMIMIDFQGEENSATGYEMLEALRPGTNFKWTIMINKPILEDIHLSLQYQGRKSPAQSAIHYGNINVNARF